LLAEKIKDADIVINLAGAPIKLFSSSKYQKIIYDSRILTTKNLVRALDLLSDKSVLFISASAVGIYDFHGTHTEKSKQYGSDFLSDLCIDWERASLSDKSLNTTTIRIGIVLARGGGFLKRVYKPFNLGLGAVIGAGSQPLPFIHITDFLRGIEFVIDHRLTGIVNFVAPYFCSNLEFSKALGRKLRRPVIFRVPSFLIRTVMGKQSSMILEGQKAIPEVLLANGFEFMYPDIESAITNLFKA
jgi:uncharacterized protein (TIGR01777 family)